jgi:hypothetical protein
MRQSIALASCRENAVGPHDASRAARTFDAIKAWRRSARGGGFDVKVWTGASLGPLCETAQQRLVGCERIDDEPCTAVSAGRLWPSSIPSHHLLRSPPALSGL